MIDTTHHLNAVARSMGTRVLDAGEARVQTITRTYATDADDLWHACTDPERISRWFLPVSGELRVGGRYQLEGNAGGTVESCDPPRGFTATWEFGGQVSWIAVRLSPADAGHARFELEHVAHVADEFWTEYGPGATGVGWELGLLGLALELEDPAGAAQLRDADGKFDDAAFGASDEGRRLIAGSSAAWADAAVASGEDEAQARAAADRTTAFYTGTPT